MVLYGSNFGDASGAHQHEPADILAGGGFRHGQHLAFDPARQHSRCRMCLFRCCNGWVSRTVRLLADVSTAWNGYLISVALGRPGSSKNSYDWLILFSASGGCSSVFRCGTRLPRAKRPWGPAVVAYTNAKSALRLG